MKASGVFWCCVTALLGACSGSTTQSTTDPETLIQNACNKVESLQCPNGITPAQCDSSLHEQRAEAASQGCAAQFDAVLACLAERTTQCNQLTKDICGPEVTAATDCENGSGGEQCSAGFGGAPPGAPPNYQKCGITCPGWELSCETDSSGTLRCTCTAGPKAGTTFTPESCKTLSTSSGASYCAG